MESEPIIAELVGGPRCGEVMAVRDMGPIRLAAADPINFDPPRVITYAPVVAYGAYVRNRSLRFVFRYVK